MPCGGSDALFAVIDKDLAGAEETARTIVADDGEAIALSCDVSDPVTIDGTAADVADQLGLCDVLVNNAAIIRAGALATLSLQDWNLLLSINLTGYLFCAQAFGRQMREKGGGAIVHMASVAAKHPTPFAGAYSVAKAGVVMLSRQLAIEWAAQNIRSNCVSPGLVLTSLSRSMYEQPGIREAREALIPARRIGAPEDVTNAVLFMASPLSSYVTGDEICVDGGFPRNLLGLVPRAGYS